MKYVSTVVMMGSWGWKRRILRAGEGTAGAILLVCEEPWNRPLSADAFLMYGMELGEQVVLLGNNNNNDNNGNPSSRHS